MSDPVLCPPEGYKRLAAGVRCRCLRMYIAPDGFAWCKRCTAKTREKAADRSGIVLTGSRQVAGNWARLCARVLCEGTKESAVGDAAELRHALDNAIGVIRSLADVAEAAGVKPAPGWWPEKKD